MKKFTIISMALFVALFCGMVGYVALSKDFEEPKSITDDDPDTDSWNMSMDDLVDYLAGQGLIDVSSKQLLASSGFCSDAFKYDGAELYWWDVENLDEKSDEYEAYASLRDEGYINLYHMSIISPLRNGPFALLTTFYTGDTEALEAAFKLFGRESSASAVWDKTLAELIDYMEENNAIDRSAEQKLVCDTWSTDGYRFNNYTIDIYYWNLEELDPDSSEYAYYGSIKSTGSVVLSNGALIYLTPNGPFALQFRDNYEGSEEEKARITEIFLNFGKE